MPARTLVESIAFTWWESYKRQSRASFWKSAAIQDFVVGWHHSGSGVALLPPLSFSDDFCFFSVSWHYSGDTCVLCSVIPLHYSGSCSFDCLSTEPWLLFSFNPARTDMGSAELAQAKVPSESVLCSRMFQKQKVLCSRNVCSEAPSLLPFIPMDPSLCVLGLFCQSIGFWTSYLEHNWPEMFLWWSVRILFIVPAISVFSKHTTLTWLFLL